ncbi:hypothetical protein KI387_034546, partial [Taxus chinensis]
LCGTFEHVSVLIKGLIDCNLRIMEDVDVAELKPLQCLRKRVEMPKVCLLGKVKGQTASHHPLLARGELNGSSLRMNKFHPIGSAPSSAVSGGKESYTSKNINWERKMHGSVGPLNDNASTNTETFHQIRAEGLKTSKSYSDVASSEKCYDINLKPSVVPPVKEKESSRHRLKNEEHLSEK